MVRIQNRLVEQLYEFDKQVAKRTFRHPESGLHGLCGLGLGLMQPPERSYYWCTPTNVLTFAATGGDGVHYSLLIEGDSVDDDSPVIMTLPANMGFSYGVGENLQRFLQFGYHCGYFFYGAACLPT